MVYMADIWISDLYGKEIITNTGRKIGHIEDVIIDFENGSVASMLLVKSDQIIRSENTARELAKNSVKYERVRSVDQTVIVSEDFKRQ